MLSLTDPSMNLGLQHCNGKDRSVQVSVVVPVTERCETLVDIYRTHEEILRKKGLSFEFIFVIDDGFQSGAES